MKHASPERSADTKRTLLSYQLLLSKLNKSKRQDRFYYFTSPPEVDHRSGWLGDRMKAKAVSTRITSSAHIKIFIHYSKIRVYQIIKPTFGFVQVPVKVQNLSVTLCWEFPTGILPRKLWEFLWFKLQVISI